MAAPKKKTTKSKKTSPPHPPEPEPVQEPIETEGPGPNYNEMTPEQKEAVLKELQPAIEHSRINILRCIKMTGASLESATAAFIEHIVKDAEEGNLTPNGRTTAIWCTLAAYGAILIERTLTTRGITVINSPEAVEKLLNSLAAEPGTEPEKALDDFDPANPGKTPKGTKVH